MTWPPRPWTKADVPGGPYLHGTRYDYEIGEALLTGIVSDEDLRLMCWATTSLENALDWACRRGMRSGGDTLYVYDVDLVDPEVDTNMHRPGSDGPISSVMSPHGIVRAVRCAVSAQACMNTSYKAMCDECSGRPSRRQAP